MRKLQLTIVALMLLSVAYADEKQELLQTRETVWRAWFANDVKSLRELVPSDTIVISAGEHAWKSQAEVFAAAAAFQRDGGKLLRLEFPRTEVQRFGDVAIIYSEYLLELETRTGKVRQSGRVTEIFVRRHAHWVNPGWHTDAEK